MDSKKIKAKRNSDIMENEKESSDFLDHFVDLFNRLEISLVLHCSDHLSEHSKGRWDSMFNHCQRILRKLGKSILWTSKPKPLEAESSEKEMDSFGRSVGNPSAKIEQIKMLPRGRKLSLLLASGRGTARSRKASLLRKSLRKDNAALERLDMLTVSSSAMDDCGEYWALLRELEGEKDQASMFKSAPKIPAKMKKQTQMSQNVSSKTSQLQDKQKPFCDDKWLSSNVRKSVSIIAKIIIRDAIISLNHPMIRISKDTVDNPKDVRSGFNVFKLMRHLDIFQKVLQYKFKNIEDELMQLIISPLDMFKFLDDSFDCVSETYPKKKQTLVKFKEIVSYNRKVRGLSRSRLMHHRNDSQKPRDRGCQFKSHLHFCSFLLLQAIKGDMDQLLSYIKGLTVLVKNFAKLMYIFLAYHDKQGFISLVEQTRIKLIPRLSCLLIVQIFCSTFCDLVTCWLMSGLRDADKHRLLAFLQDDMERLRGSRASSRAYLSSSSSSRRPSTSSVRKGRLDYSRGELRRSSHGTKGFNLKTVEKWLREFIIFLAGMTEEEAIDYDFVLQKVENRPIVKVRMSLWSIMPERDTDSAAISMSSTRDVFIAEGGHLSFDLEGAKKFVEKERMSYSTFAADAHKPKKVLFSRSAKGVQTPKENSVQVSETTKSSDGRESLGSKRASFLESSRMSTTDLAVNLIESLYQSNDMDDDDEDEEEEQNKIQVVLPRANINKIQNILASKGLRGLRSTISEKETSKGKGDTNSTSSGYSRHDDEINKFFDSYWQPKLKDLAKKTEDSTKEETSSAKVEDVIIRPTYGQVILNLDPALVAKCLVAFSLKDDDSWPVGRRQSYRSLLNPDLALISKFTTVNERTAQNLERRRKTSLRIELLPNLAALLENQREHAFQLKMSQEELDQLKNLVKVELERQLIDLQKQEQTMAMSAKNMNVLSAGTEQAEFKEDEDDLLGEEEVLISSLNFHSATVLDDIQISATNMYRVLSKTDLTIYRTGSDEDEDVNYEEETETVDLSYTVFHLPKVVNAPSGCGKGSSAAKLSTET